MFDHDHASSFDLCLENYNLHSQVVTDAVCCNSRSDMLSNKERTIDCTLNNSSNPYVLSFRVLVCHLFACLGMLLNA